MYAFSQFAKLYEYPKIFDTLVFVDKIVNLVAVDSDVLMLR